MTRTRRTLLSTLLALPLLAIAPMGIAGKKEDKKERKRRDQEEAHAAMQRGEILPLARILDIVETKVPGDIIEIELERKGPRFVYEVSVLTSEDRVREVKLDARDGALLSLEYD